MKTNLAKLREQLRMKAAELFAHGKGVREVARLLNVSPGSSSAWRKAWREGGAGALCAKPQPGPKPCLDDAQRKRLVELLLRGPRAAGFLTESWTCPRVAALIRDEFGVSYHQDHVWRVLHRLGWTCQKPERRARERDEEAICKWRKTAWPRIKKGASQAS